jgi:Holliday junction DNA helicase RuvA
VAELKGKVPAEINTGSTVYPFPSSFAPHVEEAISALVNLGYRRLEAVTAITKTQQHLGEEATLNDLIRQGLSHLAKGGA